MFDFNPFTGQGLAELESYLAANSPSAPRPVSITLENVHKVYPMGKRQYEALRGIDLQVVPGEFVAIVGPSGSGKSTILNLITGIDRPTEGTVTVGEARLADMNENRLAKWRGEYVGIVFQFFQLLPTLTALENVVLPMHLRGAKGAWQGEERRRRGLCNLEMVGLLNHAHHLPSELSGGEQQRVAIARALANDPPLLVADEPTGNLDTQTGDLIFSIFRRLADQGKTIIYVTHDIHLAHQARRLIQIRDGRVEADDLVVD